MNSQQQQNMNTNDTRLRIYKRALSSMRMFQHRSVTPLPFMHRFLPSYSITGCESNNHVSAVWNVLRIDNPSVNFQVIPCFPREDADIEDPFGGSVSSRITIPM